ncbi:amino acid ABC transporter substrate-binding protein [Pseudomonas daroniae]|uniref:Amino acid ABC transporter substrate-binding protein n=1 Tax=Phytopseudomonas daroniae TaxID=2487519 RepID=A0A4V2KBB0_9GAMM|nr:MULTISPECIES: transporter substrate-binding domain-containing protein [Pseudomonas]TBU83043.1 amino acid ABC transporter substrate-binding protein [Pseudomonas sp. FRB 228]TBU83944.1 amino acid ABC transporter substrate-binding protein [Pseudomonas daroniae]TBU93121.1 amino acid ABC transporter substrate-binding protein [Pseudomonas daroniae]
MKSWRAWFLSLFLLPWAAAAEHLHLVADTWPPFTDQRLPGNGVAVELVTTALGRAGYTSDYREVPWARAILGLQRADYDVLVNAWYSDERSGFGYFSEPYLINRIRLVQRKGDAIAFTQLSDLYPYRIAVLRGYAYSQEFGADNNLRKVAVSSFESAAHMVQRGRVSLALEDEYVVRFQFNHQLKGMADQLELLPTPLSENGLHILIRLSHGKHAEIAKRFDAAIAAMRADGSYAAIMERHGL